MHHFMGAGLCFEEGENEEQVKYQAAHHELVASAMATKLAHEIDPENKVGCMLAAGQYYPNTAHPRDYWAAMQEDRSSYFFIDVQARGEYPNYAKKQWERDGIEIEMTGITRAKAAEVTAEYFGTRVKYLGTYYDTYAAIDTEGRQWKFMSDGSITAQKKSNGRKINAGREYQTEMVSPICRYEDIVTIQEIIKNNDTHYDGLTILSNQLNISPTIYLNFYFKQYLKGRSLEEICHDILSVYEENKPSGNIDISFFTNYEQVKKRIVFKLINYEQNKNLLQKIPHIKILDLAIIFNCLVDADETGNATILIYNQHLSLWNITKDDLYHLAMKNHSCSPHL